MNLNTEYFQKCRVFLYPILGISKGGTYRPLEVYTAWQDYYEQSDYKLILMFTLHDNADYKKFEQEKLFNNKYFLDFSYINKSEAIYVFDLSTISNEVDNFINGKYSKFSESHKQNILSFTKKDSAHYAIIESFLYPEKYFKLYSNLLNIKERVLREVGELCNKIDVEKETLKLKPMNVCIK